MNKKVIYSFHFWAITIIILLLLALYYSHLAFVSLVNPQLNWLWWLVFFEFSNNINGSLLFIPFIYAALVFGWRGILITSVISLAAMVPRVAYLTANTTYFFINIILLLIPLLIVIIIALIKTWRDVEKKALAEREEDRQAYISQMIRVLEDERERISREIHDDTTQRLWILANQVQKLERNKNLGLTSQAVSELEAIKESIVMISEDTRRLSIALRPAILDDLGLVPAIRWMADQLNREGNINARMELVDGNSRSINPESSIHLFRIAQEALNNVRRHSKATEVIVKLEFKPQDIEMTIQDNGKGTDLRDMNKLSKRDKLGLLGIQERVRLLNGTLDISSNPGEGTRISVSIKDALSS